MLIDALTLSVFSMVVSLVALLLLGRGQRRPSFALSILLTAGMCSAAAAFGLTHRIPLMFVGVWAFTTLVLAVVLFRLIPNWNALGHIVALFTLQTALLYLVVAGVVAFLGATSFVTLLLGVVLWILQAASLTLGLSFTMETLDVVCRRTWRFIEARPLRMSIQTHAQLDDEATGDVAFSMEELMARPSLAPRVVLHVPCHDEPPDVVIRTLEALARIEYPRERYDVMVVDNNTKDAQLWEPLASACQRLGFQFLHVQKWPGYKSGALNFALALTPTDTEIIGVVDADYLVRPEYLRKLVAYFEDQNVAFVQTPQDYRDYRDGSTFYQRACYHAYRYFFDLSMPSRNERNAIIFGGTMGLVRADALREIGGWDEWCITEDAEASLRLLARGYDGRFVNRSYGAGLMPLEFDALKRQRFRWCFGGIQILRKHWHMLTPWAPRARRADDWDVPGLTFAQRYHYLLGGLQWYSDTFSFIFTSLLLVTGWLFLIGHPVMIPTVSGPLLVLPLSFWISSLLRTLWALRATRRCTWGEAIGAVGILWSLGWVVTLASVQGAIHDRGVFLRTPKAGKAHVLRALRSTTIETSLGVGCWALAVAMLLKDIGYGVSHEPFAGGWWGVSGSALALVILAFLQGITYLSAPALCLLSLRSESEASAVRQRGLDSIDGAGTRERRLVASAAAGVVALAALLIAANALPGGTLSQGRQQTIEHLLGSSNPVSSSGAVEVGGTPEATPIPSIFPTATPPGSSNGSASPTPTSAVIGTATPTPRNGATPSPPVPTPQATNIPHPTPTPRPHK